jgi:hypothetical protein
LISNTTARTSRCGKFALTPFSQTRPDGKYCASLSVRRGQGRQSYDRVYTFHPLFADARQALQFATSQASHWSDNPSAFE